MSEKSNLNLFEKALPQVLPLRRAGGRKAIDWRRIEMKLGFAYPPDFRELAEKYPPLVFGDFMAISLPSHGNEERFCRSKRETIELFTSLDEDDLLGGYQAFPRAGGLIPWGSSFSGDWFCWKTSVEGTQTLGVVVGTANDFWWEYDGTMIGFLTDILSGALEARGLPSNFPSIPVQVTT